MFSRGHDELPTETMHDVSGESPKFYHRFALFGSLKMGNLMTPSKNNPCFHIRLLERFVSCEMSGKLHNKNQPKNTFVDPFLSDKRASGKQVSAGQMSRVFFIARGLYTGMEATPKALQGYHLWKRRLRAPTRDTFAYAKRLREESRKDLFQSFSFIYGAAAVDEEELDELVLDEEGWARRLCVWHTNRTGSF